MVLLRNSGILISAAVFLSSASYAGESTNAVNVAQLSVPYTQQDIAIDGNIDDAAWSQALSLDLNIVNNPWNNLPSPVTTQAKIIENGRYLYVAFIAGDPNPEQIKGILSDRDTSWGDDMVGIKLDTYNSRRLDYEFFVNPYGVQNDAISNENTKETNDLWDGIWQSYGKITDKGYQVEIAIPFNILNFEQSDDVKTWAIELVRLYPRDERLRISHIKLDRDNACWVCQMPEIKGFKKAKIGRNLRVAPYSVAIEDQNRDSYNRADDWHGNNSIDLGMDVHWGITPSTSLNATINPDFSNVESDTGQLSVNKNFSLFYDEKRPFFLENADYFSSNYNLVYTRNIADPDYGVKITGREKQHSYGFFATNDPQTNIILPGNLSSGIATLNQESYNAAFNYRYNLSDDFSVGLISTLRSADEYHNLVAGVDGKYRFDDSNSLLAQLLTSNTKDAIELASNPEHNQAFSDHAYKINFVHESENWQINVGQQQINKDFRADLGYMPKHDFKQSDVNVKRIFYGTDQSWWSEANVYANWDIQHNQDNELIEQGIVSGFKVYGPKLSIIEGSYSRAKTVGLRYNNAIDNIDNNTDRFTEQNYNLYGEIQATSRMFAGLGMNLGDKIDYANNRLGNYQELYSYITLNLNDHFTVDLYQTFSKLDADNNTVNGHNEKVYDAKLTDLRLAYQFDVRSYLKLNITYSDVQRNPDNNPLIAVNKTERSLTTQLIYSYKLNPQTVFFLGYSDNSYQDDYIGNLRRDQRTFFTKISYAWMP